MPGLVVPCQCLAVLATKCSSREWSGGIGRCVECVVDGESKEKNGVGDACLCPIVGLKSVACPESSELAR